VRDLNVIEVPASRPTTTDTMAIILTGDGGWADLDKGVATALAARGVPAVGWSSLRYYWTPRTPETAANDLARIINHYTAAWHTPRVIVIGYSFGADVLPFLVNRLSPTTHAQIQSVALLGPSPEATFEFHVADWIRDSSDPRYATAPEIARLAVPVACIRGEDEDASVCRAVLGSHVTTTAVGRGHHFGGEYPRLASLILEGTR
jgi:type IV secretory pathway VirJ component